MITTSRILWIDLMKGILLTLICLSHFGDLPRFIVYLVQPTSCFWVPLFFILSGYLFSVKKDFISYLKHKTRSLLVPYVLFSICFILFDLHTYTGKGYLISNLQRIFYEGIGPYKASPLWFVWVLFGASLLSYLILKNCRNNTLRIIIGVALSLACYLLSSYDLHPPYMLSIILSATVFMLIGYWTKQINERRKYQPVITYVLILFGLWEGVIGMIFVPLGDFHFNVIKHYPLFYLLPAWFGFSCICILDKLDNMTLQKNYLANCLIWVSQNGLTILAAHVYLVFVFNFFAEKMQLSFSNTVSFILKLIFVFMALYLFVVPFINTYCHRFINHKKTTWKENYKFIGK